LRKGDVIQVPVYLIDAFFEWSFAGNPAAICPLDVWFPDNPMQSAVP